MHIWRIQLILTVLMLAGDKLSAQKHKHLAEISLSNSLSVSGTRYAWFKKDNGQIQLPVNEGFSRDMGTLSIRMNLRVSKHLRLLPETGVSAVFNNQYNLYDTAITYTVIILPLSVQAGYEFQKGERYAHRIEAGGGYTLFMRRAEQHRETGGALIRAGYRILLPGGHWSISAGWQWLHSKINYVLTESERQSVKAHEYHYKRQRHLLQAGISFHI